MCIPLLLGAPAALTPVAGLLSAPAVVPATAGLLGAGGALSLGGFFNLAGTALSLFGGQQQASGNQALFGYQAAVARNNEIISRRLAEDARKRGEEEANRQALRTRQLIGRQRVTQAALGQVVDLGSALDLTSDTAATGKLEELTIRRNAEREAIGFLTQGANFGAEAQLARMRARQARTTGIIEGLGTIVTTASRVHRRWQERSLRVPTFTGGFA